MEYYIFFLQVGMQARWCLLAERRADLVEGSEAQPRY